MYIASAAEKTFATPISIVGSVGVVLGPMFNFSQAMEKYGVQAMTMTEGKDKDMLNPFRAWVPGEDRSLRAVTVAMYDRFIDTFTAARPKVDREKLINEYGAQIYIAAEGERIGYIDDANGTYSGALTELAAAAGIKEGEEYQVIKIEPLRSFLADLAGGNSPLWTGKIMHSFQVSPQMNPSLSGKFLYLYDPSR
jgi:ClpP class serine protease